MNAIVRISSRYTQLLRYRSVELSKPSGGLLGSTLRTRTSTTKASEPSKSKANPPNPSTADIARRANSLQTTPRIVQYLGYGGAIPFIAGAFMSTVTGTPYPFARATQLYGSSILSFLGAVHWGVALRSSVDGVPGTRDFIYSVTPSLAAWCAALMRPSEGLLLLTGGFGVAFLYDSLRFGKGSAVPAWYRRLRLPLSVAAMGGCTVALLAMRKEMDTSGECTRGNDTLILSTSTVEETGSSLAEDVKGYAKDETNKNDE